jgi:hypothetical protein
MTNDLTGQSPEKRGGQSSNQRGVYNAIMVDEGKEEDKFLGELESPVVRLFVALLFAVIFGIAWTRPELGPLTILVLTGCLLYRLESWQRKLAAAPLILAAIRLCLLLPAYVMDWTSGINPFAGTVSHRPGGDSGIPWIPAFLSVCLFFLPRTDSITLKIVVVEALAVILSSLLPGAGFVTIVAMLYYTLFFAVVVGLMLDLKPSWRAMFASARAFDPATVRVGYSVPPPPRPVG